MEEGEGECGGLSIGEWSSVEDHPPSASLPGRRLGSTSSDRERGVEGERDQRAPAKWIIIMAGLLAHALDTRPGSYGRAAAKKQSDHMKRKDRIAEVQAHSKSGLRLGGLEAKKPACGWTVVF